MYYEIWYYLLSLYYYDNIIIIMMITTYRYSYIFKFRDNIAWAGTATTRSGSVFGRVLRAFLDEKRVWVLGRGFRFLRRSGGSHGGNGGIGESRSGGVIHWRRCGQWRGLERQGQRHSGGSSGHPGRSAYQRGMSIVRHRSVPVRSGLVTSAFEQPETIGSW